MGRWKETAGACYRSSLERILDSGQPFAWPWTIANGWPIFPLVLPVALSDQQIQQLVDAFPYASIDDWIFADRSIAEATGTSTDQFFSQLLEQANTSSSVLQYLLEEPDAALFNVSTRISGQIRPVANTYTDLEVAVGVRTIVASVSVVNTAPENDTVRLCHVKTGGAAGDENVVFEGAVPGTPAGQLGITLNLPLQAGEKLSTRSVNGTCTLNSYVY